jgi:pyruvate formate lyase activating enzyme
LLLEEKERAQLQSPAGVPAATEDLKEIEPGPFFSSPVAMEIEPGPSSALRVGGFVPFTSTDYPGALAAVVFCQGCPWRCRYCHNPHLIAARGDDEREFPRIVEWLANRRGLLDAVVFSGGEPTAHAGIADAVASVRSLGFRVGLHTAGAYPRRLAGVLPLLDWVGLDVKAPGADYAALTGIEGSATAAFASLDLVMRCGVAHEVRTTVHPALTPPATLERLARELGDRGVTRWVLQRFRANGCADARLVADCSPGAELDAAHVAQLRNYVPGIEVRGARDSASATD